MARHASALLPRCATLGALAALLAVLTARSAQQGPYTYTIADGQATITGFDARYAGPLAITNALGNCPVTSIGNRAFFNCAAITSLSMPDTLLSIQNDAFPGCLSLTDVVIGANVASIGSDAFTFCGRLSTVTLPNGLTSIGSTAFAWCESLSGISIPATVTAIGRAPFCGCANLPAIDVDAANPFFCSVDGVLFDKQQTTLLECPGGRTGTYTIPSTVTSIAASAFIVCEGLTSVIIPPSVSSVGGEAFHACTSLQSTAIPDGVKELDFQQFTACLSLTSISIPQTVTNIGFRVLYGCENIESITVPASVRTLGPDAFASCSSLQRIYFAGRPPSLVNGFWAFDSTPATLYYLPAYASSWSATFSGRPTKLWNPTFAAADFADGAVSCIVTGAPPIPIALEAATNVAGPWARLQTTNLTAASLVLSDPDSSGHPVRFYRIVGP